MNILGNNTAKLNDIVFENRNKSYGAYAIRSSYEGTLLKSLGITTLFFVSIAIAAALFTNTESEEIKLDTGANIIPEIIYKVVEVKVMLPSETCHGLNHMKVNAKTITIPTVIKDEKKNEKKDIIQTIESTVNTSNTKTYGNDGSTGSTGETSTSNGTDGFSQPTSEPIIMPDVMPMFDDMPAFLGKNIRYPEMAKAEGISGKVFVNFIIDENGNVLKATVLKGIGAGCDEEVLRVIKLMPKWKPGMVKGKPVKVSFNQAIIFKLQ